MSISKPQKRALAIGINKYPYLPAHYQLKGCINDVELMVNILQDTFGFPRENITLLQDETATREGILGAMDALVESVHENDIVVIHYSGHGSQMSDREGDEADGLDETIVPSDSGRNGSPNNDITDDEIYLRLLKLTQVTPFVTLIFDCCHSGTISRDPFGVNSRWVEPDKRPVEQLPPSPIPTDMIDTISDGKRDVGASGWLPLGKKYVLIAGCRDEESSYEYNYTQNEKATTYGTFTYFLSQELSKAKPGTTYRDIFERVSMEVSAVRSRQHPQMEGARDREIFGVQDIEPMRFVSVKQRREKMLTLAAGAAHGVTINSKWEIYPPGTKRISHEIPQLGKVEITDVYATTSHTKIVSENETITSNCRAVETAHFYGEMRLVVDIQAPGDYEKAVTALRELIDASDLLRQGQKDENTSARIYLIPPRTAVVDNDPVPQLGTISQAIWAVVGQDGRLMMPTHAVEDFGASVIICNNLEKVARYRQALLLKNPNTNCLLNDKITFTLKRQTSDGNWVVAEPEKDGGYVVFAEGDRIAAEISNSHNAPVYVAVLDFGLTGAVSLLHPISGANEQLAPGKSIQIGIREGDEMKLYLPNNFSYTLGGNNQKPLGGVETYKLIATTHEADFSLLTQEGFKDVRKFIGWDTPIEKLLSTALTGHGNRETIRNNLNRNEEWVTVERLFLLQSK
ncbi:MAG: caspase family protein [Scytonema sp. PMC 1069.18]|nr:caspase family protein [Scytonema sp. PMC 1069.18]MEC4882749.1 caspase family protein [Scytonema sp. PMC 1070.18]